MRAWIWRTAWLRRLLRLHSPSLHVLGTCWCQGRHGPDFRTIHPGEDDVVLVDEHGCVFEWRHDGVIERWGR